MFGSDQFFVHMILFYYGTLSNSGGTQRVLSKLVNILVDTQSVGIITNDEARPFFEIDERVRLFSFEQFGVGNLKIFKHGFYLRRVIKENNVSHFVVLDSNSALIQTIFLPKKVKFIVWEHFSLSLSKKFTSLFVRFSRWYSSKRLDSLVVLTKKEIEEWYTYYGISKKKIHLIYNPTTIHIEKLPTSSMLFENKQILAVGNKIDIKGFDLLVEAWSKIKSCNWRLKIVGLPDEELNKLISFSEKFDFQNKLELTGNTKNIIDEYLKSSFFCLSSRQELLPLVLTEALSIGLPSITFSNNFGVREIVNESCSYISKDLDIENLVISINLAIDTNSIDYRSLSENCIKESHKFSEISFLTKWNEILED